MAFIKTNRLDLAFETNRVHKANWRWRIHLALRMDLARIQAHGLDLALRLSMAFIKAD